MSSTSDWRALAASKRESVAAKIPAEWRLPKSFTSQFTQTSRISVLDVPRKSGLLNDRELELTENYDATALVELMVAGKATSYEVTTAFCKRAAIAQQVINCCTEIMFNEALVRAKECDEYLKTKGKPMGKFHGLPISLKDSFNVKGVQSTLCYVSFLSHPPDTENSALVDIILSEGAVIYVKTNIPQTMMTADSDNNVFGRTLNPNNLSLTAGGSTGGEGALIKFRGSVLGCATDIAGSIRLPALCNGVFGFKPTAQRIPFARTTPPGRLGSPSTIYPVIGPEAHSIRDMHLFLKTVIDNDPWELDENVLAVPWRTLTPPSRPIRLGLIIEDPSFPLHPPIQRALQSAATAIKEAGHFIVPIPTTDIPSIYDAAALAWKFFLLDPQKTAVKHVQASGEPWVPSIPTVTFPQNHGWEPSLDNLWDMNVEHAKIRKVFHDIVVEKKLDVILMPGYQATAVPHDTFGVPIYTVLPNLLDYPAASLPYLKAEKELDKDFVRTDVTYAPPYTPEAVEGAPSSIQLVGRPMKDEELLNIIETVGEILKLSTE
ncbi:amidase [Mytilinidion resinicola]|uniref:Amidase n=1 Tax=Mytilinidion resinicola TaxID=574789 RepID=A0A6A6YTT1_9PEZI|nr:amidase [Mytilinidion resinicola]KAF2811783.1 amidase [Mytilinidion resinicola]